MITIILINLQTWRDEFLTWNPDDYNGITQYNEDVSLIWTPDVTLRDK